MVVFWSRFFYPLSSSSHSSKPIAGTDLPFHRALCGGDSIPSHVDSQQLAQSQRGAHLSDIPGSPSSRPENRKARNLPRRPPTACDD